RSQHSECCMLTVTPRKLVNRQCFVDPMDPGRDIDAQYPPTHQLLSAGLAASLWDKTFQSWIDC
ncbi:hypothetical protein KIPB_005469, partial [Kipferlia bialata]